MYFVNNYRLPGFYRHVLVFAPFAGSALGLFTIVALAIIERVERRKVRKLYYLVQPVYNNNVLQHTSDPSINTGHSAGLQQGKELGYGSNSTIN